MVIIVTFFLVFFGLMGMQLFATYGRYRCFYNGTDPSELEAYGLSVVDAAAYVPGGPHQYDEAGMLDPGDRSYIGCAAGFDGKQCADPYLFNLNATDSIYDDIICADGKVNPELWNFDDFGWTSVTLFQVISMVGWVDMLYAFQDATGWYAVVYFMLAVLLGQFVILNLIIAVLGESYEGAVQDAAQEAQERRLEKKMQRAKLKMTKSQKIGEKPLTEEQEEQRKRKKKFALLQKLDCFRKVSPKNKEKLQQLTTSRPFRFFFIVLVLANVITLSITKNDMTKAAREAYGVQPGDDEWEDYNAQIDLRAALDKVEWAFASFFAIEMLLKMAAVGTFKYLKNGFNVLDTVIVLCSFVEVIATVAGLRVASLLNALRALRVFRIFKLASNFKSFRVVLAGTFESLQAVFAVTVIMIVVLFIEAIISMNFFGGKFGAEVGDLVGEHEVRFHFDYFMMAMASTWMCITTEAYTNAMYHAYEQTRDELGVLALVYFMQLIAVGTWVMLNLFLAILCNEMAKQLEENHKKEDQEQKVQIFVVQRCARILQRKARKRLGEAAGVKRRPSQEDDRSRAQMGQMMNIKPHPLAPELSAWEVAAYQTMFERSTQETGGRLRRDDLGTFLDYIGVRRRVRGVHRAPFAASEFFGQLLNTFALVADTDADRSPAGSIGFQELLTLLNKYREDEREMIDNRVEEDPFFDIAELFGSLKTKVGVRANKFASLEKPLLGVTCCCLGRDNVLRKLALRAYYSRLRNIVTVLLIVWAGTNVGFVYGVVQTTGDSVGYRNALERDMGTHAFYEYTLAIDCLFWPAAGSKTAGTATHWGSAAPQAAAAPPLPPCPRLAMGLALLLDVGLLCVVRGVHGSPSSRAFFSRAPGLGWRLLDLIVLIQTFIVFVAPVPDVSSAWARPYRAAQCLRLLTLFQRIKPMLAMVNALLFAVPQVGVLVGCTMLVMLAFAVIGVSLFGSGFGACVDAAGALPSWEVIDNRNACLAATSVWEAGGAGVEGYEMPLQWEAPGDWYPSFDTTANAMYALFQIMFLDGWSDYMFLGVDCRGPYLQPAIEFNYAALLYFFLYTFVGPLFFMNLIIGAVVSTFEELHRKGEGMHMLTDEQRRWVYTQQVLQSVRLLKRLRVPRAVPGIDMHPNNVRRLCFRICTPTKDKMLVEDERMRTQDFYGEYFAYFIIVVIIANTAVMASYAPRSDMGTYDTTVSVLTNVFSFIYGTEFVIKILGLGTRQYFRDKWNIFDFFLVLVQFATLVGTAASYFLGGAYQPFNFSYLRALRVVRLARYSRSVRQLLLTVLFGLPDLVNISCVFYVFIYVCSVLGMTLFSGMELSGEGVDQHANFNNIYISMQTVFRFVTGDAWSVFYLDALEMRYPPTVSRLSPAWVHAYFMFFMLFSLILTAIFVAIIIKNYSIQRDLAIDQETVHSFSEIWLRYDKKMQGYIPVLLLGKLVSELEPPLSPMDPLPRKLVRYRRHKEARGWFYEPEIDADFDEKNRKLHEIEQANKKALDELLHSLRVPVRTAERQVHFLEVLTALAERSEGLELPESATRVRQSLLIAWARRLPQLLTLPPVESCSDRYADGTMEVYDGASLVKVQAKVEEDMKKQKARRNTRALPKTASVMRVEKIIDSVPKPAERPKASSVDDGLGDIERSISGKPLQMVKVGNPLPGTGRNNMWSDRRVSVKKTMKGSSRAPPISAVAELKKIASGDGAPEADIKRTMSAPPRMASQHMFPREAPTGGDGRASGEFAGLAEAGGALAEGRSRLPSGPRRASLEAHLKAEAEGAGAEAKRPHFALSLLAESGKWLADLPVEEPLMPLGRSTAVPKTEGKGVAKDDKRALAEAQIATLLPDDEGSVSKKQLELRVQTNGGGARAVAVTRFGPNPSYLQRLVDGELGEPVFLPKGEPAPMAPGDIVWLGKDKCPLRLLEVKEEPKPAPLALPLPKPASCPATTPPVATGEAASEPAPAAGRAAPEEEKQAALALSGPLFKRSPTTGMYQKRDVSIEGATIQYTTSSTKGKGDVAALSGRHVSHLLITHASRLEFAIVTKKTSPEQGRLYEFRCDSRADFERWSTGLEKWIEELGGKPTERRAEPRRSLPASDAAGKTASNAAAAKLTTSAPAAVKEPPPKVKLYTSKKKRKASAAASAEARAAASSAGTDAPSGNTVAPGSSCAGAGSSSDPVARAASLPPQQKALSWLDQQTAQDAEQSYEGD